MANDVKALPVVAWIWRWADGEEEVVFVDATTIKFNPEFEDVPTQIASLVRQSDAESALAELRAEVERLRADARRYEYILNCEVLAASKYIKVDPETFKANRRAAHDAQILAFLGEGK